MKFENEIICGDCLDVMKDWPDGCVDLVLTDPPYGIDYQSNMRVVSTKFAKLENDNNDSRLVCYRDMYRLMKANTVAVAFCSYKNYAVDYAVLESLFDIKNAIIWFKGGGGIGDLDHSLSTDYEIVLICHKGRKKINGKRIGSVWHIPKVDPLKMVHPTEKPALLLQRLIKYYSNPDDLIFDPYIGSGTTCVAAKMLGRRYIGIDISPEYCQIAKDRLRAVDTGVPVKEARAGQGALFE